MFKIKGNWVKSRLAASVKCWFAASLFVLTLSLGSLHNVAGQDSSAELTEAKQLDQRALDLRKERRYDEALPLAERARAIMESHPEAKQEDLALALNIVALLYEDKGNLDQAEPLYQRAVVLLEKALGPEHRYVASALTNLAGLYAKKGDYARAEAPNLRALAIREKVFGPDDPLVAYSLDNLAGVYKAKRDYDRAEPLYQRALAIREKAAGADDPDVAFSLGNLAALYRAKGDFARAEPLFLRALAIREKAFGPESPFVANSLNDLSELYHVTGDHVRAEPMLLRTLAIREKVYGPDHPFVAIAVNNLAAHFEANGDVDRAALLYQRALAIWEKKLGPDHPDVASALNNLALLYLNKGDYTRAEPMSQRALAIWEKAFGPEDDRVGAVLNNLAEIYAAVGEPRRAEPLYQRALAITEKALGVDDLRVAPILNNLAFSYSDKGDYARAEATFQRALAIRQKALGPEHSDVAVSLGNLAAYYEGRGDYVSAVQFQERAEAIREHNLGLILSIGSEAQKQFYLNTLIGETNGAVSLHVRSAPDNQQAARLAFTSILRRKGRALEAMTDQLNSLRQRAAPADQQLLDQLAAIQAQRARAQLAGNDQSEQRDESDQRTADQRLADAARLTSESDNLQAEISRRSAEFRALTQPVSVENVQQALPPNTALVELFSYRPFNAKATSITTPDRFGAPRYVAYVLKPQGAIAFVDLGPTETINGAAEEFLDAISNPASLNANETARALDELLMRPIRKLLGDVRNVLISPDGKLNLVPFGALVDEQHKYLIENYTITYLTSGRDLLRLNLPRQSKQTPVVIANPAYNATITSATITNREPDEAVAPGKANSTATNQPTNKPRPQKVAGRRSGSMLGASWNALPGTAEEADYLKKLLPDARVLTGAAATESALKRVVAPRILHLATHGFFLPDEPLDVNDKRNIARENPLLRSGLILSGANNLQGGDGEDGVLTSLEAAGLNLWGTKLVVLSACETGVGDVRSGEGVYGLRRAFVLAGAESQLMTLWKVDDTATSEVIIEYYRRLQAGEGRSEALRQVQLEFLQRKTRQHPFFWAGFILNGDWRRITFSN